jgi:hypothetical protein
MNTDPFKTREVLARLPQCTQRFWTWLTALTHQREQPRKSWTANQHMAAYLATCVVAFALAGWTTQQLAVMAVQPLI